MSYSENLLSKQGNLLTHFAHRSRFAFTLKAVDGQTFDRALDYGCGDGHLLRQAASQSLCRGGTGVDFAPAMLAQARLHFGKLPAYSFVTPSELRDSTPDSSFDVAFCTEALEHIRDPGGALDLLVAKLRPGAQLVVSVPIEVGPSLLLKQVGRYAANWNGMYGYDPYRWSELVAAGLRRDTTSWPNAHNGREGADSPTTGHRGFDFRKIEALLRARVRITRTIYSPLPMLGSALNSTVLWVATKT